MKVNTIVTTTCTTFHPPLERKTTYASTWFNLMPPFLICWRKLVGASVGAGPWWCAESSSSSSGGGIDSSKSTPTCQLFPRFIQATLSKLHLPIGGGGGGSVLAGGRLLGSEIETAGGCFFGGGGAATFFGGSFS